MTTTTMTTTTMTTTDTTQTEIDATKVHSLGPGQGRHLHFLNHLATLKTSPGQGAAMSAVEFTAPRDFGPPLHAHDSEDEILFVLEGEIATEIDGTEDIATAGTFVWLPHGVAHSFQVVSDTARFLTISASVDGGAAEFDAMVEALGDPVDPAAMPAPEPIDPGVVATVCAAHGIDVLGPPPAPRAG